MSSLIHLISPPTTLSKKSPTSSLLSGEHAGAHANRGRAFTPRNATIVGSLFPDLDAHVGFCGEISASRARNFESLRTCANAKPSLLYLAASSRATAWSCAASAPASASPANSTMHMSSPQSVSISVPDQSEKYKRARGREGERARGREGERARGREGERARGGEGERGRGGEGERGRGAEEERRRGGEDERGREGERERGRGERGEGRGRQVRERKVAFTLGYCFL